jgi:hypothetical protein
MNEQTARILLQSLLERLDADARRDSPQFLGAVSKLERAALAFLLDSSAVVSPSTQLPSEPLVPLAASAPSLQPPEVPVATANANQVDPGEERTVTASKLGDAPTDSQLTSPAPLPAIETQPEPKPLRLDETALSFGASQDPGCVLCLDFGTARSKAFAAVSDGDDDPEPELIELGLGRRDGDPDAIYTVASSIWISNEGILYVGSEAMRRSAPALLVERNRRRLDSVKQQLTLAAEHNLAACRLEPEFNPTTVALTYEDAICLFLAYLTDLSVTELAAKGKSRYVKRRFTIPAWRPEKRSWAESALAKYMSRAQILADTFHGQWQVGIKAETWKAAVSAASAHDAQLSYLLDTASGSRGVLEPLAAGSGRVWADSGTKNLLLVVDVGAGTTDFSLFWVVQNIANSQRKAYQVAPYSDAIGMAGDFIDERLLLQILALAHGGSDELVRKRIEGSLRLTGLRSLKERLFMTGEIQVTLESGQTVSITLDEFLNNEQVKGVVSEIEKAVQRFLSSVDVSWTQWTENAQIVLTGGGANMPNVAALSDRLWEFGGTRLRFRQAPAVPKFIADNFDDSFQREYPQLAVAIGGALPVLDEKTRMEKHLGSANRPGPLSGYHVTGA